MFSGSLFAKSVGEEDEGTEAFIRFAAAHGDASVFLDLSEKVLDQMPPFVGVAVELRREAAIGFRRDDRVYPGTCQHIAQPVGIKRPVGKELITGQSLDQPRRAAQVVRLSG